MNPINQLNVLMIEDDDQDIFLTAHYLKKHWTEVKYVKVDTVADMMNALKVQWDVILCDYHLPEFSGLTALRMIRDSGSNTPFILVSGQVSEDIAAAMMQLGANDYVMKGNLKRLAPAIERELKGLESTIHRPILTDATIQRALLRNKKKIKERKVDSGLNELLHVLTPGDKQETIITERHKAVVNILLVAESIRQHQATILARQNLTQIRLNVLRILKRNLPEALSLNDIREEVFNKSSDLSRMIQKMEDEQLIAEAPNSDVKRGKRITITTKGLAAIAEMDKCTEEMFLPESSLSEEDAKAINAALMVTLTQLK